MRLVDATIGAEVRRADHTKIHYTVGGTEYSEDTFILTDIEGVHGCCSPVFHPEIEFYIDMYEPVELASALDFISKEV